MFRKNDLRLFLILSVAIVVFIAGMLYIQNYGPKVRRGVEFTTVPEGGSFTIEAQSTVMINAGNCGGDFVIVCEGRALETIEEERPLGTDCTKSYFVIKPVEVSAGKCEIFARGDSDPEFNFTSSGLITVTSPYDQGFLDVATAFLLIVIVAAACLTLIAIWD